MNIIEHNARIKRKLVPLSDLFDLAVNDLRVILADDTAQLIHDLRFRHGANSPLLLLRLLQSCSRSGYASISRFIGGSGNSYDSRLLLREFLCRLQWFHRWWADHRSSSTWRGL